MGRTPCCQKVDLRKGPWSAREDALLIEYIQVHGEGNWKTLPSKAGLLRCGKSCRLRWKNYLQSGIKLGNFTADEDDLILRLHSLLGNRWSLIAGRLPGRTDNEIKNHWHCHISKRLKIPPNAHKEEGIVVPKCPKVQKKNKHNTMTDTNLYRPKPVKVSSAILLPTIITNNSCLDYNLESHHDLHGGGGDEKRDGNAQVLGLPSSWFDLTSSDDASFHLSCQYPLPKNDNMDDKFFGEYLQLLNAADDYHAKLDSLIESFFV